ncbi:hypothetical protein NG895_08275 [Aeoliella sp. ICT_H6.2]|uniref:Uncharacterized protein n=1 Tax=Aeoliella straminimaris TaxID=2954799 RepID=A0A9X2JG14_9BACT|nr:hypothetical protein [Aeoliella straminimaris]MCO6043902.1 hypothetical protein [Aeoliella straminimaris]
MLHYFTIFTAIIGLSAVNASAAQWQSDYATALKQTRSDDRPMLMVIDQPGVAEKSLDDEVISNDAKGALADYDLCRVDASTKYGAKVAEAFGAKAFPYVACIDKSGKVILDSASGEINTDKWTKMVTKNRTGEKPVRRVVAKPAVTTSPVSTQSYQPYTPQARPYCAKCQRGY